MQINDQMILVCTWNHETTQDNWYLPLYQRRLWIPARTNYQIVPTTLAQCVQCVRHCTRHGPESIVLCFVAIVQVILTFVMAKICFKSTKQLLILKFATKWQTVVLYVIIELLNFFFGHINCKTTYRHNQNDN